MFTLALIPIAFVGFVVLFVIICVLYCVLSLFSGAKGLLTPDPVEVPTVAQPAPAVEKTQFEKDTDAEVAAVKSFFVSVQQGVKKEVGLWQECVNRDAVLPDNMLSDDTFNEEAFRLFMGAAVMPKMNSGRIYIPSGPLFVFHNDPVSVNKALFEAKCLKPTQVDSVELSSVVMVLQRIVDMNLGDKLVL